MLCVGDIPAVAYDLVNVPGAHFFGRALELALVELRSRLPIDPPHQIVSSRPLLPMFFCIGNNLVSKYVVLISSVARNFIPARETSVLGGKHDATKIRVAWRKSGGLTGLPLFK